MLKITKQFTRISTTYCGLPKFIGKIKTALAHEDSFVCLRDPSPFLLAIVKVLYTEGLILSYLTFPYKTSFILVIKVLQGGSIQFVHNAKLFIHPSKRYFYSYKEISTIRDTYRLMLFTTSFGLLNLQECKKFKIGGILLLIC